VADAGSTSGFSLHGKHSIGSSGDLPEQAIESARREIQTLAREIADLARAGLEPAQFYEALLSRLVAALGAVGGAVWVYGPTSQLELAFQINLPQRELAGELPALQHTQLLHETAARGETTLVPPKSGPNSDVAAANPTGCLLLLGLLSTDAGVQGVVEIFQRAETSPVAQRGYTRFVSQMCELASDYLKERRLRDFTHKQSLWEQLESFARTAHESLEIERTSATIANEGRRLIGCDRVSVALQRGRKARLTAISGQEVFERRAQQSQLLERLVRAVIVTGESLWFTGERSELAPQVERALDAYIDVSQARFIAVLPLARETTLQQSEAAGEAEPSPAEIERGETIGALVVEQLSEELPEESLRQRVEVVARHSGTALANARQYHSLFLLPLWQALGRVQWLVSARTLPKTLLALMLIGGIVAALCLVPADFQLEAKGTLQPALRREVFASIDGVVMEVPVRHAQQVAQGDLLATMRNTDLEVQITDVMGQRESTAKQMRSIERALLGENRLSIEEQNRLSGQLLQLRQSYESLDRQLELYREKEAQLQVLSPIAGQIVTWQVRDQLARRPVRQGQILMSVADPSGPWELEVAMPEDRMGHIAEAARSSGEPLRVTYILATEPGVSHVGIVKEIQAAAELRGEEGNTVLLRVEIDDLTADDLRPGATATAKVDCGRRSLGYVWLHDVVAFVQRKILFKL
jgi:multidrug efflux pump subunit AcrA (membrane-fusion protein)